MDYKKQFSSLGESDRRIVPQYEAILLLAIIDMLSKGVLIDNEIHYNEELNEAFLRVWKKLLNSEMCFSHYLSEVFWNLSSEPFWHVIPQKHKEDIISLMRNHSVHPSENKIKDSINYVELDQDLYFLMTMPSSRKELKRTLLENYFDLSPMEISSQLQERKKKGEKINGNELYESLFQDNSLKEIKNTNRDSHTDGSNQYESLSLDTKIEINLVYFNFLKKHLFNREVFVELFPDVSITLQKLLDGSINLTEQQNSVKEMCSEFLTDLRFALMTDNSTMELVDQISKYIQLCEDCTAADDAHLDTEAPTNCSFDDNSSFVPASSIENSIESHDETSLSYDTHDDVLSSESSESDIYKKWTTKEEVRAILYFKEGRSLEEIANYMSRSIRAIYDKLKSLGYDVENLDKISRIEEKTIIEKVPENKEWFIENKGNRCFIYNRNKEKIYTSTGKLFEIEGKPYRIYRSYSSISINEVNVIEDGGSNGKKILYAGWKTDIFKILDSENYFNEITGISIDSHTHDYVFHVNKMLFSSLGELISDGREVDDESCNKELDSYSRSKEADEGKGEKLIGVDVDFVAEYRPKSKFVKIAERPNNIYDCLLMLSIVDFVCSPENLMMLSFEELACRMIANAWELSQLEEDALSHEKRIKSCIEYLIVISNKQGNIQLNWKSSKDVVYNEIKEYKIEGVFKETVDALMEAAPFIIDNFWIKTTDMFELISCSKTFTNACLYSINLCDKDSYIEINPKWKGYLLREGENLTKYYRAYYLIHEREK